MTDPDFDLISDSTPQAGHETDDLYKEEIDDLENEQLREQLKDLKQDRAERKTYSDRLFKLIVGWLTVIAMILVLHGLDGVPFKLSGATLITLIGSTTASVLGLFAIVAKYLFPKR